MYKLKNLRKIRENKSITVKELAKLINKDSSDISKLERGIGNPTIKTVYLLCNTLNTTELIGVENINLSEEEEKLIEKYRTLTEREKGQIDYVMNQIMTEKETSSSDMGKSSA